MTLRRTELKYQGVILDSYKLHGGTGRKWATDLQAGMPDLVLSLPGVGGHLAEVKHRPEFGLTVKVMLNPLTKLQRTVANEFLEAGAFVMGLVIGGGAYNVKDSRLYAFDPWRDSINSEELPCCEYNSTTKYHVTKLAKTLRNGG